MANSDRYLLNRGMPSSLPSLKDRLKSKLDETYNLSLINALVMFIEVSSVVQAKARSGSSLFISSNPGVIALAINLECRHSMSNLFIPYQKPLTRSTLSIFTISSILVLLTVSFQISPDTNSPPGYTYSAYCFA